MLAHALDPMACVRRVGDTDDQRDVQHAVVDAVMLEVHVVLGHALPVVAGDEDRGVVPSAQVFESGEEFAHPVVAVPDLAVVLGLYVVEVVDAAETVVVEAFEEGVHQLLLDRLPARRIAVLAVALDEAVAVLLRHDVGRMRIPWMQEQEERLVSVGGEPLQRGAADPLHRGTSGRDVVIVSPEEPRVAPREIIYRGGGDPRAPEEFGQDPHAVREARASSALGHDAMGDPVVAGEDAREPRMRGNARRPEALEQCAFRCERVHRRAGVSRVSVTAEVVRAQGIYDDQDDVQGDLVNRAR